MDEDDGVDYYQRKSVSTKYYKITGTPTGTKIRNSGNECVYIVRNIPSRMRPSDSNSYASPTLFSPSEVEEIMKYEELQKIFKSIRIGCSKSEDGAINKIYRKSTYISFAALQFIIIDVPSGMKAYLFEQLLLLRFSQTKLNRDQFGEYRFGVSWKEVVKTIENLKENMYTKWSHRATIQRGFVDARQSGINKMGSNDGGDGASFFYLVQYGFSDELGETSVLFSAFSLSLLTYIFVDDSDSQISERKSPRFRQID